MVNKIWIHNDKAMKFEIDEKFISETIYCKSYFDCLKNENHFCLLAKVDNCIAGKVHFITCTEKKCKTKLVSLIL